MFVPFKSPVALAGVGDLSFLTYNLARSAEDGGLSIHANQDALA